MTCFLERRISLLFLFNIHATEECTRIFNHRLIYPRRGRTKKNFFAQNRRDMSPPTSFRIDDDYGYPFSRRIISQVGPFPGHQPDRKFILSSRGKIFMHVIEILGRESDYFRFSTELQARVTLTVESLGVPVTIDLHIFAEKKNSRSKRP